jgi:NAD(P)-dependent dehydrogenase (short-subunit alcohol dehydrogenase family)
MFGVNSTIKTEMKTVFITGAAQGIGLACAKLFAAKGWFVGLYDINEDRINQLLASGNFPNACGCYCDVTSHSSIDDALNDFSQHTRFLQANGRLDVLVNNAGVCTSGKFEDIDQRAHDLMMDVNVKGMTLMAQSAFPLLRQTPKSTLVNLCSVSSVHGIPQMAVYSASKFFVNGLTEALNIEWAEYDIRVTSVKPPLVNTSMGKAVVPELTQKMTVDLEPEDVAHAINEALDGKRVGYLLGSKAKLWACIDKCLPEFGRRGLTRWLCGY